jgi:ABC-type sugar transport system ATPase subunit
MEDMSKAVLEGKNLSKEYNGNTVLRDVSIRCVAGVATAIVGENGAGKTTLMNILGGGLKPTSGTIEVDGQEVRFIFVAKSRKTAGKNRSINPMGLMTSPE